MQYFKYLDQRLCCLQSVSTLCCGIEVRAVSLPEKNIESRIKIMKLIIEYDTTNKYDTEEVVTLIKKILRMEMV